MIDHLMPMCWDKLGGHTSKTLTLFNVQGDSGGSVMHLKGKNYESIGIVSWGVEGCQVHPKSAFHKIHNHCYPLFLKSLISTINNHDLWHEVRGSVSDAPSDLKPAVDPQKPWRSYWSWILSSTPLQLKDPASVRVRQTPSSIVSLLQAKANTGFLCHNMF